MTKDYFDRSAVMLIAEKHFMQEIIRAQLCLTNASIIDCFMDFDAADSPKTLISFYESLADSHIKVAKEIVQHLYNEEELPLDDARVINHMLVWFNYPEVETDA